MIRICIYYICVCVSEMMDHKRDLAEWCWQHEVPPPLYDREAVGPSTQVLILATLIRLIVVPTRGRIQASCFAWLTGWALCGYVEDWNIWTFYWHRQLGVEVTGQVGVAGEGDGEGGEQGGGPAASCKEGEQLFSFQRILLINHKNKDKEQGEGRAADSSTNWRENGSKTSKNIPRLNQKVTGAVQPASARPREEDEHNDFPTSHQEDFPRGALHYNIESIKSHWVNWAQQANQQVDNDYWWKPFQKQIPSEYERVQVAPD